jgi:hypothetical protein
VSTLPSIEFRGNEAVSKKDQTKMLSSSLPSVRTRAVQWFVDNATKDDVAILHNALAVESVPRIKSQLAVAMRKATDGRSVRPVIQPGNPKVSGSTTESADITLNELSRVIAHELVPGIGWIRSAANKEIHPYQPSRTHSAIEGLRRRMDGLMRIVDASRPVTFLERIEISELVLECMPPEASDVLSSERSATSSDDLIETDRGLMSILLSNAMHNAIASCEKSGVDASAVVVRWSVTDTAFSITISNPFSGLAPSAEEILSGNLASSPGHRGLGMRLIGLTARRLGYELAITTGGGIWEFTVGGSRVVSTL